jgi:phosphatidylserine/phosphatidylglycerophosphate/cardiolipin synthase-like enzyme
VDADRYMSVYALRNAGLTTDGEGRVRSNLVYVHAKLMIVDDIFLTMGSANANSRSMDGYRDTELNVAVAGERDFDAKMGGGPWRVNKKIHTFRRRLWKEHLGPGASVNVLADPADPETITYWRAAGPRNWQVYDELYKEEMKLADLMDTERKAIRQSPKAAANLGALRAQEEAAHQRTLDLYRQVKSLGHLIEHPYKSRHES